MMKTCLVSQSGWWRGALSALSFVSVSVSLTGCGGVSGLATAPAAESLSAAVSGRALGGQQAISGAHVYLYGVGATGYGSASVSLLKSGTPGVTTDGTGSYLTTDGSGNLSFTGANYACTAPVTTSTPTYMVAMGGNPGLTPTANNSAIVLLAAVGNCGNYAAQNGFVINELSTVAMLTAAQQFYVDPTHVGSSAGGVAGLSNAMAAVNDLYNVGTGAALAANRAGTGTVPQAKLNTLGNILAPCVNTSLPTSMACANLFAAATPAGSTAPTTVAGAMLLIAQNPSNNVGGLYGQMAQNPPYQTALPSAPNDFAVGITISGGGITTPTNVVIDASNDAWVASCGTCSGGSADTIVEVSPAGGFLSGPAGYGNGIHMPQGMAFDLLGNLWSINLGSGGGQAEIVQQSASGGLNFAFHDSTIQTPEGIAIDNGNSAWVTNQTSSSVVKINNNGTRTLAPVTNSGLAYPTGIAIDGFQYIYAAGTGSGSVLKLKSDGSVQSVYYPTGVTQPVGLSIDGGDNIFSFNNDSSAISQFNGANGTAAANSPYSVQLSDAYQISLDGAGTGWVANCYCESAGQVGSLIHFNSAGTVLATLKDPSEGNSTASAIDGSGNVWVVNFGSGNLTEYLGVAAPVMTPLVAASSANKLATRP